MTDERLLVHAVPGRSGQPVILGPVVDAGQKAITQGALPVLLLPGGTLGAVHLVDLRALDAAGIGTVLASCFKPARRPADHAAATARRHGVSADGSLLNHDH